MTKTFDNITIGSGFRSMVGAYCAARNGQKTALLERGKSLGGFMAPIKWGDFYIDKGPQFFDNFEKSDKEFIEEMLGEDILEDIGFSYASYRSDKLTDNFALPDWTTLGEDQVSLVLADLLSLRVDEQTPTFEDFDELIKFDGGKHLYEKLETITHKFLCASPKELSPRTRELVTFLGRKVLFDNETSVNLKQSPLLDSFLAAQKVSVGEERYNLYPKGSSLETVRLAMVDALTREGVEIITEADIDSSTIKDGHISVNNEQFTFGELFMGIDIRDAETFLFDSSDVLNHTHMLPEIFHCYVVPADAIHEAYYTVDYEPDHYGVRLTNFSNYMGCIDQDGYGVFCVEEPIEKDSDLWNAPETHQAEIFKQARKVGNVTCDTYREVKSFRVPVTYKVPKVGIEKAIDDLIDRTKNAYGERVVIPDGYTLTRKQALDNLRSIGYLQ